MFMTITSFHFLVFLTIALVIYYILPGRFQWMGLLVMSLVFYHYSARTRTILYLLISTLSAYACTMGIETIRQKQGENTKKISLLTTAAVAINFALWFVFKGYEFWAAAIKGIEHFYKTPLSKLLDIELVAALGMGYYTLQIAGYVLDCAWGTVTPQKNPFKLFLFVCFFPQLTTGPISQYSQLEALYQSHPFQPDHITRGAQRILWGFFKKLVLAERAGVLVSGITANLNAYPGCYAWIAILMYPIQMYADFSGCMDIVIGAAEMFDIQLAENFRNPFFSRSSQEFWQRWHITLGAWARNYVLYPLMKAKFMVKFGKFTRKKFGKNAGKFIATCVSMFILWIAIGAWHGGFRFIVGVSLWYWIILMSGELLSPVFQKTTDKLGIRTDNFSWHLFQSARTYLIYAIGITFFSGGVGKGIELLKSAAGVFTGTAFNPWVLFDESILRLGITWGDINLIIIAVLLLIIVGILSEKYGYARNWIEKQGFAFRWFIWITLFLLVLIYGKYGPEYHAEDFIYQRF